MRSVCRIGIFALLVPVLNSLPALAQVSKSEQIDNFLKPFIAANQFGGQIAAAENGKVIYQKAFGLANADFKIPNDLHTRIGIASITKQMTLVILTRLIEEKRISMDDKLSKYVPDFPQGEKITIDMLANHRSGIPHRVMAPEFESVTYSSTEFVELAKKAKLDFEPGARSSYSSGGYAVLARCLEVASGKSYAELLEQYVFGPADMRDSVNFYGETVMDRRAQDYYPSPDGVLNVPLKDYSFLVGAGSVFGTANDVLKFGKAIITGKYGDAIRTGWVKNNTVNGSGSTNGHRAYFEIDKDNKYGYAIVANMSGAFDAISKGISEILQGKPLTAKFNPTPTIVPNPNKDLNEFRGHFEVSGGNPSNDIVVKNGFLYAGDIKLYPTKPDCFFEYRFFGNVCFTRDTSNKITGIKWTGEGFDLAFVKR